MKASSLVPQKKKLKVSKSNCMTILLLRRIGGASRNLRLRQALIQINLRVVETL